ncbi:hypothetical protein BDY21DRAFT_277364 [Lineolata rhizophorae]|uniref:F-box domain-containing protein n=1 Tax=Lineolata rhizophorae TaxID=578093 RepID=A0A6A6PEW4_9PEZI|nr:hypothetical protein BDY21DRAFT_277364 [Lineolata rhizophorae]
MSRRRAGIPLRSNLAGVSYRESSPEDDSGEIDYADESDFSEATAPSRGVSRAEQANNSSGPSKRRKTRAKATVSYHEPDSDDEDKDDDGDSDFGSDVENGSPETPKAKRARTLKKTNKRASPRKNVTPKKAKKSAATTPKRGRTMSGVPAKHRAKPALSSVQSDHVIPPWTSLPYEILLSIFTYAAYPMVDEATWASTRSASWLVKAATTCRAFAEPALTALYRCPPLALVGQAHQLLDVLSLPKETKFINYNVKVFSLDLEIRISLASSYAGRGRFTLESILPHVPQLSSVRIFDRNNFKTHVDVGIRHSNKPHWHYSNSILEALKANNVRLKRWVWDEAHIPRPQGAETLRAAHSSAPFQTLRSLHMSNFISIESLPGYLEYDLLAAKEEWSFDEEEEYIFRHVTALATAINALPNLSDLAFNSCNIVHAAFFTKLQRPLEGLTIMDCHYLTHWSLIPYLRNHGNQLKKLHLCHNDGIGISTFGLFHSLCQSLEDLKMDFSNVPGFRTPELDNNSLWMSPRWPSTLRDLELVHMRHWGARGTSADADDTHVVFLQSFIDAATALPTLRRLVIHMIIHIDWRERATFRDKWVHRLEHVFLRKRPDPDPALMSLKNFRLWKEAQVAAATAAKGKGRAAEEGEGRGANGKGRAAGKRARSRAESGAERRQLRPRGRAANDKSTTSNGEDESTEPGRDGRRRRSSSPALPVQGLCDVVDIRIDNMRLAATLFNEGDFLDSDNESDGSWDGTHTWSG